MNHLSGYRRKLSQNSENEGRQIVTYINKRIKEKAEMEKQGIPFFKANENAYESQDMKRLNLLEKLYKIKRKQPNRPGRIKELQLKKSSQFIFPKLRESNYDKVKPIPETREKPFTSPPAESEYLTIGSKSSTITASSPCSSKSSSFFSSHEHDADDESPVPSSNGLSPLFRPSFVMHSSPSGSLSSIAQSTSMVPTSPLFQTSNEAPFSPFFQ